MAYSGNGLKNDFGGHDNDHHDNIYAFAGKCMGDGSTQLPAHVDYFYDNKCILNSDGDYATFSGNDDKTAWPIMGNNSVFTPNAKTSINGNDLADFQAGGHDLGTTVDVTPSDDQIIAWAKDMLDL